MAQVRFASYLWLLDEMDKGSLLEKEFFDEGKKQLMIKVCGVLINFIFWDVISQPALQTALHSRITMGLICRQDWHKYSKKLQSDNEYIVIFHKLVDWSIYKLLGQRCMRIQPQYPSNVSRNNIDLLEHVRFVAQIEILAETSEAEFLICFSSSEVGAVLGYQLPDLGLAIQEWQGMLLNSILLKIYCYALLMHLHLIDAASCSHWLESSKL